MTVKELLALRVGDKVIVSIDMRPNFRGNPEDVIPKGTIGVIASLNHTPIGYAPTVATIKWQNDFYVSCDLSFVHKPNGLDMMLELI